MRALLQRVKQASVEIDGEIVGEIGPGLLVLIGVTDGDTERECTYLADKTAGLRIFEDENGKMNRSLPDVGGELLAVSQFTLYADCSHGRRPSFTGAARPETAEPLCRMFAEKIAAMGIRTATGRFGADMQVCLQNDGPVTIMLDTALGKLP